MKFPIIELVDRYCIAIVKSRKTNNANAEEVFFYIDQLKNINIHLRDINYIRVDLKNSLAKLFDNEIK